MPRHFTDKELQLLQRSVFMSQVLVGVFSGMAGLVLGAVIGKCLN